MLQIINNLRDLLWKQFGKTVNLFDFAGYTIEEIQNVESHYGTPGVYIWFENGKPLKVGKSNAHAGRRALEHLGVTYRKGCKKVEEVTISEQAILILILFQNSWETENYWEDKHCLLLKICKCHKQKLFIRG